MKGCILYNKSGGAGCAGQGLKSKAGKPESDLSNMASRKIKQKASQVRCKV
jgi:hypothetical protein